MSTDKTLADVKPGGMVRLATVLYDRAHDLLGEAYNAGTHGIGYSQQAMELHDAIIPAQPSQPSSLDLEAMLATCVPGGSIVDPQVVADNIRHWFSAQPSPGGQGDARRQWLEIRGLAAAIVKNLQAFADSPHKAAWCGALDDSLLFADQIEKAAAAAYEADLERRRMA